LAAAAHYLGQGKVGSAFDIAASTYGGAVVYRRFDPDWLISEIESGKKLSEIVDSEWKGFSAESIELPEDFILCVAWTGSGASTKELVLKIREFKKTNEEEYWGIIDSIRRVTEDLIEAIKRKEKEKILELIDENRKYLRELGDASGTRLETEELAKLADIAKAYDAAGKFSGAGGGDCGIAVCFDPEIAMKIKDAWKKAGLYPLDVSISGTGLTEEWNK
jgi:phosphomevalonate kinase